MKIEVEYLQFMWPMKHFLITCGKAGEKIKISWGEIFYPNNLHKIIIADRAVKAITEIQYSEN